MFYSNCKFFKQPLLTVSLHTNQQNMKKTCMGDLDPHRRTRGFISFAVLVILMKKKLSVMLVFANSMCVGRQKSKLWEEYIQCYFGVMSHENPHRNAKTFKYCFSQEFWVLINCKTVLFETLFDMLFTEKVVDWKVGIKKKFILIFLFGYFCLVERILQGILIFVRYQYLPQRMRNTCLCNDHFV